MQYQPCIDPQEVDSVFNDLLYDELEIDPEAKEQVPRGAIIAEGVSHTYCFHPARFEKHIPKIHNWVWHLPYEIDKGCSFLKLCYDCAGQQWTGFHCAVEQLVAMGVAAGALRSCTPAAMWPLLPGGMPFYQRTLSRKSRI